ncbi:MAG: hypothetical protein O3C28_06955 [Proteobacteria bacterium]|nr:hypothetical protein [Pseudomonadota bacterium]
MNEGRELANVSRNAVIVYVLYLAGFVLGITPLIGLVLAYISQEEAPSWLQTHYKFQIRTWWIGLLFGVTAFILSFVLVGFFLIPVIAIWLIVRCVKGLNTVTKQEPIGDPDSWLFG